MHTGPCCRLRLALSRPFATLIDPVSQQERPTGSMAKPQVFSDVSPIFVVGAPRSGTTLLSRILDGHPALGIADELIYFDIILNVRSVIPELDTPERIERLFQLLPKMDHVPFWQGMEQVLAETRRRLLADPAPSYPRFYLLLMQVYADQRGAVRFGEKTPWNVRHLDEIVALFPQARIIHLVRDPRANVASRRKLPRTSRDVVTAAVKWKLDVLAGRRFATGPNATPANYIEQRYEDLVADPEPQVRRLCAFIGEPFDPRMLALEREPDVMFKDQPWKEGVFKPVHTGSLQAWRKELTPAQARIVELVCAAEMRHFGYPLDGGGSLLGAGLRLPAEAVDWIGFKRADAKRKKAATDIEFAHGSLPLYRLLLNTVRARFKRQV